MRSTPTTSGQYQLRASHTHVAAGTYEVTVTVLDGWSDPVSATSTVTVG